MAIYKDKIKENIIEIVNDIKIEDSMSDKNIKDISKKLSKTNFLSNEKRELIPSSKRLTQNTNKKNHLMIDLTIKLYRTSCKFFERWKH